jgi:hypothetical protein
VTTLYVAADAWDALTPAEQADVIETASVPVTLGQPAVLHGTFDVDGIFTADIAETPTDPRWYAWDDPRITEDHALAVATAVEGL